MSYSLYKKATSIIKTAQDTEAYNTDILFDTLPTTKSKATNKLEENNPGLTSQSDMRLSDENETEGNNPKEAPTVKTLAQYADSPIQYNIPEHENFWQNALNVSKDVGEGGLDYMILKDTWKNGFSKIKKPEGKFKYLYEKSPKVLKPIVPKKFWPKVELTPATAPNYGFGKGIGGAFGILEGLHAIQHFQNMTNPDADTAEKIYHGVSGGLGTTNAIGLMGPSIPLKNNPVRKVVAGSEKMLPLTFGGQLLLDTAFDTKEKWDLGAERKEAFDKWYNAIPSKHIDYITTSTPDSSSIAQQERKEIAKENGIDLKKDIDSENSFKNYKSLTNEMLRAVNAYRRPFSAYEKDWWEKNQHKIKSPYNPAEKLKRGGFLAPGGIGLDVLLDLYYRRQQKRIGAYTDKLNAITGQMNPSEEWQDRWFNTPEGLRRAGDIYQEALSDMIKAQNPNFVTTTDDDTRERLIDAYRIGSLTPEQLAGKPMSRLGRADQIGSWVSWAYPQTYPYTYPLSVAHRVELNEPKTEEDARSITRDIIKNDAKAQAKSLAKSFVANPTVMSALMSNPVANLITR